MTPGCNTESCGRADALCLLRDVHKSYGRKKVLGPISLEVRRGEILGVKGPNGAGKSTLLSVMAGVLEPDGGERLRSGEAKNATSYLPQELSLYSTLTGCQNLRFWGLACGLPLKVISLKSRRLLKELDLEGKGKMRVSAYSGGMKRRLHLATALMGTPAMLLLDEPTVGADDRSAELILNMISHMRDSGCGVVMISHRAGELEKICDRILTLENGLPVSEDVLR